MGTRGIPSISFIDNLVFNLGYIIPYILQGIFTRNRLWFRLLCRVQPDPMMVRFGYRLRRKYSSDCVYVRMLAARSLLVLTHEGARRILERSPEVYGPPPGKVRGMSHFQPNAVTISKSAEWKARRAFNDAVLGPQGDGLHADSDHYAAIIFKEVETMCQQACNTIKWEHIDCLLEKITLQIVFGKGVKDTQITTSLQRMMHQSNRFLTFRKSRYYDTFNKKIQNALRYPSEKSLVARCPHQDAEITCPENQVPHWLFAMRDTLAENTARGIIVILSDLRVHNQIRNSVIGCNLYSAREIHTLDLLENSIQEAMRLWPTTPIIARQTLISDVLCRSVVGRGVQVLVPNHFLHRDTETIADADVFRPERWAESRSGYRFNHFSNGPQACAGKALALFVCKSVIANLIVTGTWRLQSPARAANGRLSYCCDHYSLRLSKS